MDGDSFFVEELEVFSESSDVFYGTFIFTVVPDRHSEITQDTFSFFLFPKFNDWIILTPIYPHMVPN